MERSINSQVHADIANEVVSHYGELSEDFPQKMRKRLKRKFRTDLDLPTISILANHFKEIYNSGAFILKDFLSPKVGEYATSAHVDAENFIAALVRQYPKEDKEILKSISAWVIYYEYFR